MFNWYTFEISASGYTKRSQFRALCQRSLLTFDLHSDVTYIVIYMYSRATCGAMPSFCDTKGRIPWFRMH